MPNIYFLIDGFNLYHAVAAQSRYTPYKWLSLEKQLLYRVTAIFFHQ